MCHLSLGENRCEKYELRKCCSVFGQRKMDGTLYVYIATKTNKHTAEVSKAKTAIIQIVVATCRQHNILIRFELTFLLVFYNSGVNIRPNVLNASKLQNVFGT